MALDHSHDQIAERLEKLRALREHGVDPYPCRFAADIDVTSLRESHDSTPGEVLETTRPGVTVGGRVMSMRTHGKTGFFDLSDGRSRIQVYVRRDGVPEPAWQAWARPGRRRSGATRRPDPARPARRR